jgi:hypothetical protein
VLHEAVSPVFVQPVNQSTDAASLDYSKYPEGMRVIAVGGNSLSRGLTLEGLSTSYFLRNARTYDTLLQMGRWFGYRDGFADLCRVWLTSEAEGWYRHVTDATAELKRDFARMRRREATPQEFGLRVRTHPDTLLITARNKMATGMDVTSETRGISLMGRGVESARLYTDEPRNRLNFELVERFIGQLVASYGIPVESPHHGAVLWKNVAASEVAVFLDGFAVHPLNHDFQGDSIAEFLRSLPSGDDILSRWTVALLTTGAGRAVELNPLPTFDIAAKRRKVEERAGTRSLLVSGSKARVGSRKDVLHGLSVTEAEQVKRDHAAGANGPKEDDYRAVMQSPLLLIYLIRGLDAASLEYRSGMVLPALGLHFPGVIDPDAPRRLVRYRLNVVAQDELLRTDRDDDEPNDEPDN